MAADFCNEKDPTNKLVLDFIRKYHEDAQAIAKELKIPVACEQFHSVAHKCGAACKDFELYGYCDRRTTKDRCWQHS